MSIPQKILQKIVQEIIRQKPKTEPQLMKINRKASGKYNLPPLAKRQIASTCKKLVEQKKLVLSPELSNLLKVRAIRTLSGIAPVTVLTKPYKCPGRCIYCPSEPKMPKSYLSNEPAVMRAISCNFDPYKQVQYRLKALIANGHQPEKIELLVLGGTWSAYPWKYQQWFIKRCFEGANEFGKKPGVGKSKTLKQEQKINEKAKYRIIGITLETRPDLVAAHEIKRLRELGCTRIQLGVQILDDKILDLVKRGHHVSHTIKATKLLKDNCFKIDYHIMPNLPGSTPAKDIRTVERVFYDSDFRPDQLKLYPTVVSEYAPLYKWYKKGKYKPYPQKRLVELLIKSKTIVPYYCRINRLIRDIPEESIMAGNKVTNLRQILQKEMQERGLKCKCIRCREVRNRCHCEERLKGATWQSRGNCNVAELTGLPRSLRSLAMTEVPKLYVDKYKASDGTEYFISYESPKRDMLYAFVRLRINGDNPIITFPELKDAALIRELHTYGMLKGVSQHDKIGVQHKGLGRQLMAEAEEITKKHGLKKIAVISGIGVRDYYRKLSYRLQRTYMVKVLKN